MRTSPLRVILTTVLLASATLRAELVVEDQAVQILQNQPLVLQGDVVFRAGNLPTAPYVPPDSYTLGMLVPEATDVLYFINKDRLHGELETVGSPQTLRWVHESAAATIEFNVDAVSHLKLKLRDTPITNGAGRASINLTNGDILTGNLVTLDASNVVIETEYAGLVKIKRAMLTEISPGQGTSSVVYRGPKDIRNWTYGSLGNRGGWDLVDGALQSSATTPIGRAFESIPDQAEIAFEATWQGTPYFYVSMYTDDLRRYNGNGYAMRISSHSAYMYRCSGGSTRSLGSADIRKFLNDGGKRIRFGFYVDRGKKQITFTCNGQKIQTWTDSAGFAGGGNGLLFYPQSQCDLRVSNIMISNWDGKMPEPEEEQKTPTDADTLAFVNQDKISGALTAIQGGQAQFKTSYGDLPIPLERIEKITFSETGRERARRYREDVVAHLSREGRITLRLASLREGNLQGSSENFGDIKIPIEHLKLIEFNIYTSKTEDNLTSR